MAGKRISNRQNHLDKPAKGTRFFLTLAVLFGMVVLFTLGSCMTVPEPDRELENLLASARGDVPGIAVSVMVQGEPIYRGAAGVRKAGTEAPVTVNDRFHIGSNTKSMTAVLCALLVEQGLLSWESTVGEILGGTVDPIRDEYLSVTLEELLSHTAGFPPSLAPEVWRSFFPWNSAEGENRQAMTEAALAEAPVHSPGSTFLYSNLGYVVAGRMCELVTGDSWESLMLTRLFTPLGMGSSGFGPPALDPGSGESPSAVWGHLPDPVAPDAPGADNPAALGPAGTVHSTLKDLERYLALYWPPAQGGSPLLKKDSLERIMAPVHGQYGLGWFSGTDARGEHFLTHDGSNGMFLSRLIVYPERGDALIILTNSGTAAAQEVMEQGTRYFLKKMVDHP